MAFGVLFASFVLGCWVSDAGWTEKGRLDDRFFVESTRLVAPGEAVFGGYLQAPDTRDSRKSQAAIYRWAGDTAQRTYEAPGWVSHVSPAPGAVWALASARKAAETGSDHRALRSDDGGRTWTERGPIPGDHASELLGVSMDEAWVLGVGTLLRTTDGGATWVSIQAPGARNPVRERLHLEGGRVLLLGDGVRATADGGATWMENGIDNAHVRAVAGAVVAGELDGALKVGVMERGGARWLAAFPEPMTPFRLVVAGATIRMLAVPTGKLVGRGLLVIDSADNGKSWKTHLLHVKASAGAADVLPDGSGVAVDDRRRILAP